MNLWRFLESWFKHSTKSDFLHVPVAHLVHLAYSRLRSHSYIEARGLLLQALNRKDEIESPALRDWILNALSQTWEGTEEYQQWTAFFSNYMTQNPNHAVAYELRAESHWYGGNLRLAMDDYSRCLELDSNDAAALLGRGQVFMESQDFDSARKDLDAALASLDSTPQATDPVWKAHFEAFARNGRAAAYAGLGDFNSALEEFQRSIDLCPENGWVYFNRAVAYQNQGDPLKAAENYRLALTKKEPKLTRLKRAYAENQLKFLNA